MLMHIYSTYTNAAEPVYEYSIQYTACSVAFIKQYFGEVGVLGLRALETLAALVDEPLLLLRLLLHSCLLLLQARPLLLDLFAARLLGVALLLLLRPDKTRQQS